MVGWLHTQLRGPATYFDIRQTSRALKCPRPTPRRRSFSEGSWANGNHKTSSRGFVTLATVLACAVRSVYTAYRRVWFFNKLKTIQTKKKNSAREHTTAQHVISSLFVWPCMTTLVTLSAALRSPELCFLSIYCLSTLVRVTLTLTLTLTLTRSTAAAGRRAWSYR